MNEARRRTSWAWWLAVIVLWAFIGVVAYPLFRDTHHPPSSAQCVNNLHQIALVVSDYMGDWDDRLPPIVIGQSVPEGKAWPDFFKSYVRTEGIFRCPKSWRGCLTYSFNRRLSGRRGDDRMEGKIHQEYRFTNAERLALIFDSVNDSPENNNLNGDTVWRPSDGGVPRVGSLVIWPDAQQYRHWPKWAKPRHSGRTNVLYVDGHVKSVDPSDKVQFDPKAHAEQ